MLKKFKDLSIVTKLLYLLALILFIAWVLPTINTYYNNVNTYEENIQEIETVSTKYGIDTQTQKFSETLFKQDTELLFSKVDIKKLDKGLYAVHITMKKEDLKSFHTFLETISLRYYVEIKNNLEFKAKNEVLNVKMSLQAF